MRRIPTRPSIFPQKNSERVAPQWNGGFAHGKLQHTRLHRLSATNKLSRQTNYQLTCAFARGIVMAIKELPLVVGRLGP